MNARLFCKTGQLAGADYEIGNDATIGKSTGNTIQLYPTIISGNHARIVFEKNSYFLEDLKSRNGTRLDGVRVSGRERLDNLNVITFADKFDFIFQVLDENDLKQKPKAPGAPAAVPRPQTPKTVLSDDFAPMPGIQARPASVKEAKPIPEKATPAKTIVDDGSSPALPPIDNKRLEPQTPPPPPVAPPAPDMSKTVFGDDFAPMPIIPDAARKQGEPPVPGPGASPKQVQAPRAPVTPSTPPVTPVAVKTLALEFRNIKSGPSSFTLKEGENVVGREAGCDITIDDASLSRRHAMLTVKEGHVKLKDLGSKNHTFAAGTKITSEIEIQAGVALMFGVVTATLK